MTPMVVILVMATMGSIAMTMTVTRHRRQSLDD